jgi:hypothetical protein
MEDFHGGHFAIEPHHRIKARSPAKNLGWLKACIVAANGKVAGDPSVSQRLDYPAKVRRHILESGVAA